MLIKPAFKANLVILILTVSTIKAATDFFTRKNEPVKTAVDDPVDGPAIVFGNPVMTSPNSYKKGFQINANGFKYFYQDANDVRVSISPIFHNNEA